MSIYDDICLGHTDAYTHAHWQRLVYNSNKVCIIQCGESEGMIVVVILFVVIYSRMWVKEGSYTMYMLQYKRFKMSYIKKIKGWAIKINKDIYI